MKRSISVLAPSAMALGVLFGCAPSLPPQPPAELQDARAAYSRAESGPAAQNDRHGLLEAREALDAAERKYGESPESTEVKTLGYGAQRKAQIAEADGRAAAALQVELEKQQALAGRSERRAKVALDRLGLTAVDEPRGTVITLAETSMFATNEATILPAAKGRLTDIANAVKEVLAERAPQDVGRKIMLIGYTDNVGSDEHNVDLSRRRADAVRAFFSKHGLDDAMLETEGRGEADPIAENKTAQGRAKNRRVEIVITSGGSTPGGGGAPQ